jgi:hypothetical protein
MPIDPSIIAAGIQVGTSVYNAASAAKTNLKSREFSSDMYARQLEDARNNTDRQNAYNSPVQQMARLKAAHLNPNLVYGNGSVANQGTPAGTPSAQTPHSEAPRLDGKPAIDAYYQVKNGPLVTDNLALQNALIAKNIVVADSIIKKNEAESRGTTSSADTNIYDLEYKKSMHDTRQEQEFQNVAKVQREIQVMLDANQRANETQKLSLGEMASRILLNQASASKIPAEIEALKATAAKIKAENTSINYDNAVKSTGAQPHDNPLYRLLQKALTNVPEWNGKWY